MGVSVYTSKFHTHVNVTNASPALLATACNLLVGVHELASLDAAVIAFALLVEKTSGSNVLFRFELCKRDPEQTKRGPLDKAWPLDAMSIRSMVWGKSGK